MAVDDDEMYRSRGDAAILSGESEWSSGPRSDLARFEGRPWNPWTSSSSVERTKGRLLVMFADLLVKRVSPRRRVADGTKEVMLPGDDARLDANLTRLLGVSFPSGLWSSSDSLTFVSIAASGHLRACR